MSLSGMTITLLLMVGVISVAFAQPNHVDFEGLNYLAKGEELLKMETIQSYHNCVRGFLVCRLPPTRCEDRLYDCLSQYCH